MGSEKQQQLKNCPAAAISLLDKYANLNNGIESTRKESTEIQLELDNIQSKIQKCISQDRNILIERIQTSQEDLSRFKEQEIPKISKSLEEAKALYNEKYEEKNFLVQELSDMEAAFRKRRSDFLNSCQDFRENWCKRIRIKENRLNVFFLNGKQEGNDYNDNDNEENTNNDSSIEDQISKARKELAISLQLQNRAHQELIDVTQDHKFTENKTSDRKERLESQRLKVENLRKDIRKIEQKISEIETETSEAKALTDVYKKDLLKKKQSMTNTTKGFNPYARPQHSSSKIRNPYAKQHQTIATTTSTSSITRTSYLEEISSVQYTTNKTTHNKKKKDSNLNSNSIANSYQYPHREGRIRGSRQFELALEISNDIDDDDDDDDDDELLSFVAFGKSKKSEK